MKNLVLFLLVGFITFTSCTPEATIESVTPVVDFSGTYSGMLTSNDDDNEGQILNVEITSTASGNYTVIFMNEEAETLFNTSAAQEDNKLMFGWESVQTLTEGESLELQYDLEFIDDKTLELEMNHKFDSESDVLTSSSMLERI